MEKVRPWCVQPSDRGRLRNRTEQNEGCQSVMFISDTVVPINRNRQENTKTLH